MKKATASSSRDTKYRNFQLKIEIEELALDQSLREAQEQLKHLNRDGAASEDEDGALDEREVWAIKINHFRSRLRLVRESLDRLRSGNFGVCVSCNQDIGEKRLNAVPTAIYCLECQQEIERERARPYDQRGGALYAAPLSLQREAAE